MLSPYINPAAKWTVGPPSAPIVLQAGVAQTIYDHNAEPNLAQIWIQNIGGHSFKYAINSTAQTNSYHGIQGGGASEDSPSGMLLIDMSRVGCITLSVMSDYGTGIIVTKYYTNSGSI